MSCCHLCDRELKKARWWDLIYFFPFGLIPLLWWGWPLRHADGLFIKCEAVLIDPRTPEEERWRP